MATTISRFSITDLTQRFRWLWMINAFFMPWLALIGIIPAIKTGNNAWLALGFVIFYVAVPILDYISGQDPNNHDEADVPALDADNYFRWALFVALAGTLVVWFSAITYAWYAELSILGLAALALSCMGLGGAFLNLGHELGHKKNRPERWAASLALGITALPHFSVEHNRGHHRDVATPHDHASSRLGENFYRFMLREMPGTWLRGWRIEADRLHKKGLSFWSTKNEILPGATITVLFFMVVGVLFGPTVLLFVVVTSLLGHTNLTAANYVEHYGLLRKKLENGRYETPQPEHSWNQNSLVSNLITFQLQRHSDHHAHPSRRYQCLRHFEDVPQLPAGYYAMFMLAYIPPLWFMVMDKKVLNWADNDINRINVLPSKRAKYENKINMAASLS